MDQQKSQQLIQINNEGKLSLCQELPAILQKIPEDANISILTVLGKYRTGKSYLLNKIIMQETDLFQVGNSVNACTKGIWVQNKLIKSEIYENTYILVLDTEGLYSTEQSKNSDSKLFLISILLSSLICYNSIGVIDEYSLQDLGLMVQVGKDLAQQYSLPNFHWVLRDFVLKQQRPDGSKMSSKEYLEECLKEQKQFQGSQ